MNLDKRTVLLIIGVIEKTKKRLETVLEATPKYRYLAMRKATLIGHIEALTQVIILLNTMMEDQE